MVCGCGLLCGNQAIAQTQLRGQRRVDGVERLKLFKHRWSRIQSQYLEYDKTWGFAVRDAAGIRHGFLEFVGGHSELIYRQLLIVGEFVRRLRALLDWFECQDQLEFISSSLLLVYNGNDDPLLAPQVQLKIIDFAHVRRGAFIDSGYIEGLRKVISLLEDITHAKLIM